MKIQLTPEDEKLVEERLRNGAFRALAAQDFEARWLARNK